MRYFCYSSLMLAACVVHAAPVETQTLPPAVVDAFTCYTGLPSKLVAVLQMAKDKESAEAAAPQLHEALAHIYTAREKLHHMPRLTPAQNQLVRTRYGQSMREEWGSLYAEIARLKQANAYHSESFLKEFRLMCMMIEK